MGNAKIKYKLNRTLNFLFGVLLFLSWYILPTLPKLSVEAVGVRKKELLLSSFTTYFDSENVPRTNNIRLACERISGTVLFQGEVLSFNEKVGARTEENGFFTALVILEHAFVPGVGGGVCQVSTTLYNAALLAGLTITEVRAHSLKVGYVPPSFDSMVSSESDLKIKNTAFTPVRIEAKSGMGAVTVCIYGKKQAYDYATRSVTLSETETADGKKEIRSEGYLLILRRGKVVSSKRIRRDKYGTP